ncbi:MAG: amidophosphoribosyltransferase [Spirochaetaceae bacterium]|nr:MAG: amidophosphoribosyltransferase [Spirochaetaceae bacterium]
MNTRVCNSSCLSLRHHCGVVGISANKDLNMPERLFYPLFALQHRGQESAGIAYQRNGKLVFYKNLGMVSQVLSHYLQEDHVSRVGIGHVRYSTQGGNKIENAQPFCITCNKGQIAFGHNGNISNSDDLRATLFDAGSIFQSTSDTELILHLLSRSRKKNFREALLEVLPLLQGAYSGVFIHEDTLVAVRDPMGFRPLVMGKSLDMTVFASETCALDTLGISTHEEVAPGEIIMVKDGHITERFTWPSEIKKGHCIFELIYFARPDSTVFGYSVHMLRKKMGAALAAIDNCRTDIVIPVPDSGNSAALGFSVASGTQLEYGLTRNHYSGRTFIQPTPQMREFAVRLKLHPIKRAVTGKKMTVIDDSLVRGTTSKILITLLREAGAKEIHLRLCSPEIKHPCFFGIDIPTPTELISNRMTPQQIAESIGADSVQFLSVESLRACVDNPNDFCYGCFSGDYPCPVKDSPMRRKN